MISLPSGADRIDYEAEVGVVINEQCRNGDETDAVDVVSGFTNVDDVSNRADQGVEQN